MKKEAPNVAEFVMHHRWEEAGVKLFFGFGPFVGAAFKQYSHSGELVQLFARQLHQFGGIEGSAWHREIEADEVLLFTGAALLAVG